jgi:hypothetical protein
MLKELCSNCTKSGECPAGESIKRLPIGEVTEDIVSEYKALAEEENCTKIKEVKIMLQRIDIKAKPLTEAQGSLPTTPPR